jgi:RNA polymerase sigma factor (sigma-70 family)
MANNPMSEVLQHLRRVSRLRDGAELTDGQLLEDFLDRRDEAALTALIRRHGPMVWGVCCRLLRNHHDAEDAFQATFLVLVRKASSVRPREMIANWLYGVARQTALKARATATKRWKREVQVTPMAEPAAREPDVWHDLQPLLDQALTRLPDIYRVAVVLCDLEGNTRKEAARQLGVPEGTLAARLARGRVLLAKRLGQRGVVLSGGTLGAVLSQHAASAGVPPALMSTTIKAAAAAAAGQAVSAGAISAKVAALAKRGVTMYLLKWQAAILALVMSVVTGLGVLAVRTLAKEPPPVAPDPEQGAAASRPIGGAGPRAAERTRSLPTEEFARLSAQIKPQSGESRYMDAIPWVGTVWDARKKAAAEGKPLLIIANRYHGLGSC